MEDKRRRVTATELNVPYNPQSSLLQLLNSSRRIRHLVTNFYYGRSFPLSGKMRPEDILQVFSPAIYLIQLHRLHNRPANRPPRNLNRQSSPPISWPPACPTISDSPAPSLLVSNDPTTSQLRALMSRSRRISAQYRL
jgi:hypothetical protein